MFVIPRATEKTYNEQTKNTYVFIVPAIASKQAIAEAIKDQFKVTVISVRTLMRKGKATRFSRGKRAYPGTTYRQDKKFAYVTLQKGDKIRIFEEAATETEKEPKAAEIKTEKPAKKSGIFNSRRAEKGDK